MPIIESLVLESFESSPKSHRTHNTCFEDAHSEGIDDLVLDLTRGMTATLTVEDSYKGPLIAHANANANANANASTNTSPSPPMNNTTSTLLSASEMESSRRVRKKYGLEDDYAPSIFSTNDGPAGSIANFPLHEKGNHVQEVAILYGTMQILSQRLASELIESGSCDESHPLLTPFLALVETALHHGWRGLGTGVFSRPFRLWDLLKRTERLSRARDTKMNIENVRNFSSLTRSAARVRAWIRLALMNKRLAADLTLLITNEGSLIA